MIKNNINSKIYIGVHRTDNPYDNYLGSGAAITAAIKKYGKKNFFKEILFKTEDIDEAYQLEYTLTEHLNQYNSYNLVRGGIRNPPAGKSLIEKRKIAGYKGGKANKNISKLEEHKQNISKSLRAKYLKGKFKKYPKNRKSRIFSDETRKKLSEKAKLYWESKRS